MQSSYTGQTSTLALSIANDALFSPVVIFFETILEILYDTSYCVKWKYFSRSERFVDV